MPETIIADTSCFILLTNINQLDLLQKLYGTITTTTIIAEEFKQLLPEWVNVKLAADNKYQRILELQVDKGEASAIALALEITDSTIILDDLKARQLASHLGISITGTLGIIIKAKQIGIIPSIKPLLEKIRQTNFRISPTLESIALKEAGE
ncbi:DUF3368 domain-containing protein [Inquilinus sp. KBS0705]|nr:DUF3368 domain-containing protein [Inquilinus sp. KBS0705]